ncbi:MAG: hypothetical protein IJ161_09560 [Bacteroidales bacterium]|nr:hypothetical protein [Bacteroidales bacterium]
MSIPFSFLVSWAKVHRNEDRSLTYVTTLEKKNLYQTVEELLSSPDNGKKISDLRAFILPRLDEIQNAYSGNGVSSGTTSNSAVILGALSGTNSFAERLKAFIKDYLNIVLKSQAQKRQIVFGESFIPVPFHTEVAKDEDLANQIGVSGQNIRDHRNYCITDCRQLLIDGIATGQYCAEPSLIQEMNAFKNTFENGISYETACRLTEINDDRTFYFLLKILDLDITYNSDTAIRAILPKGLTNSYSKCIGRVIDFFRDDPICLRYNEDIVPALMKITKDIKLLETFKAIILNSDEFIKYQEKGHDYIALRWDHLKFLAPRVCWIVFNQKAFDLKSAVSGDKIVTLYNSKDYAGKYKEEKITRDQIRSSQLRRCWRLMNIERKEYWMIKESKNYVFDKESFAKSLQTPGMSFAQYIQAAKDSGLIPIYPETAVAYFYTGNGTGSQRFDWTLLLNESEAMLKSNNAPLKSSEIAIELYHRHQFSSSFKSFSTRLIQMVKEDTKRFIWQSSDSARVGVWVGLPGMVFPESYRTVIKKKAVDLLLKAPNYTLNQDLLYRVFGPYVPDDLVEVSALSSIFSDDDFFIKNGDGKKREIVTITLNPLLIP